jgi:hypothetical protein
MTAEEKAVKLYQFVQWARSLPRTEGVVIVQSAMYDCIGLAAEELEYFWRLEAQRAKIAREKGKKGGRPKTAKPAPGTLWSRKSRAKKK